MGNLYFPVLLLLVSVVGRASSFITRQYNGNDYKFSNDYSEFYKYTWYEARSYCMQWGGDLVTIEDTAEGNWLRTVRTSSSSNQWLGLNKFSGEWAWADGKDSTWTKNWYTNHPVDGYLCTYKSSYSSYYVYSLNCAEKRGIICKRPAGLSTVTPKTSTVTSEVGGFCPAGYIGSRTNRCYKLVEKTSSVTWTTARKDCQSGGHYLGDLACITDKEESALITMLITYPKKYHIGLKRTLSTSYYQWTWADNSVVGFTNWYNTPSSSTYGCGYIYSYTGKWYSTPYCTSSGSQLSYICQVMKDPGNVISTPSITLPHDCTNGYAPYGKGCYKILTQTMNWDSAKQACIGEGAQLVDIHTAEENAALQYMMYMGKVDTTWTGFKFDTAKQQYLWSTNWYVVYTNWGSGQPKREEGGGCVSYHVEDSEWYDALCTTPLQPICKTTSAPPVTAPPEKEGRCLNNQWTEIGGHCYKSDYVYGTVNKRWLDQQAECRKLHQTANLASIHDYVTMETLRKDMLSRSSGSYWIGMYRSSGDNLWRWIDGSPVQYTNFYTNEPAEDPSSGEDCVYMSASSSTISGGKWYSYACKYALGYVCKMDKLPVLSTPPPVNGTCPGPTWEQHGDKCYLYRPDEFASWNQAQGHCIREGGNTASLAMVTDYYNNDVLHSRMVKATTLPEDRSFWIGLARKDADSSFVWIDGTNSSGGFEHWDVGQPEDADALNCAQINIHSSMWHNAKCDEVTGYVCQAPVVPYGGTTPFTTTTTLPTTTTKGDGKASTTTQDDGSGGGGGEDGGLSGGAVAGIVIGVLLAVAIAAAVVFVLVKGTDNIPFLPFNNTRSTVRGFDGPASVSELEREAKSKDDRFL